MTQIQSQHQSVSPILNRHHRRINIQGHHLADVYAWEEALSQLRSYFNSGQEGRDGFTRKVEVYRESVRGPFDVSGGDLGDYEGSGHQAHFQKISAFETVKGTEVCGQIADLHVSKNVAIGVHTACVVKDNHRGCIQVAGVSCCQTSSRTSPSLLSLTVTATSVTIHSVPVVALLVHTEAFSAHFLALTTHCVETLQAGVTQVRVEADVASLWAVLTSLA